MTMRETLDEIDEDERERLAAGGVSDEPDAEPERVREFPEIDLTEQAPQGVLEPEPPSFTDAEDARALGPSEPLPDPKAALAKAFTSPGQSEAAERMQEIASRRYTPSAAVSDDAIAKARADRKAAVGRNDFTRAIQAWMLRKPFNPTDPEDEAGDLLQQRSREESQFNLNNRNEMSAQAALARALRGEKTTQPGALTEYQRIQIDRQNREEEAKRKIEADKAAAAASGLDASRKNFSKELVVMGIDPTTASQKDIDRAISLRHAKAQEAIAGGNYAIAKSNEDRKANDRAALGQGIPFAGGELKYVGQGTPREDDFKKAQDIAGGWNAALSGMDELEQSLAAFAASPSVDTKRDVESKVRVVSSALNSAIGGGAMSEAEAQAMSQALGADIVSPQGLEAAIRHLVGDDPGAARGLLTRLRSVRSSAKATALGKLKSYRYNLQGLGGGGGAAVPTPTAPADDVKIGKDGKKYRKNSRGKWEAVGG